MIRALDPQRKGYVTMEEFMQFFQEDIVASEEEQQIPNEFLKRQVWKNAVN
jgi:Ca2+-binding EF-hand superfamily protein